MKKFLVGSRAFFDNIEGFHSKDSDYLELVENPTDFKYRKEMHIRGTCIFKIKKEAPALMVQRVLEFNCPMMINRFLIPEVANEIGLTVNDILPLEIMVDKLDDKHKYLGVIFNAVKENNSFEITDEQRQAAYEVYKSAREEDRKED